MDSDPATNPLSAEVKLRAVYDNGRSEYPLLELEEVSGIDDKAHLMELLWYAIKAADSVDEDEGLERQRPMSVKADASIQSSRVADLAALEPIRIEITVERKGAGRSQATMRSNLTRAQHQEVADAICPDISQQMEELRGQP